VAPMLAGVGMLDSPAEGIGPLPGVPG
jgi:hypothetical protein